MSDLDSRICIAIDKLDQKFGQLGYIICGSVALYIQGIDLGREPHDFDIIIPNTNEENYKRYFNLVRDSGFILDFPFKPLNGKEEISKFSFNGKYVNCQTIKSILQCKEIIVQKNLYYNDGFKKQQKDIEKLKSILNI